MKTLEYAKTVPAFGLSGEFLCARILLDIEYQKSSNEDILDGFFDFVNDSVLMMALKLYLLDFNNV